MVQRLPTTVGALACVALAVLGQQNIEATPRAQRGEQFVPSPEAARLAALGFDALVADYYWLQAVQVVGGIDVNPAQHGRLLGSLVDVTTSLDPWVDHPYRFAAVWLTETEREVRTAVRLLERAIQYHPEDWRNYFHLGFHHFHYLDELEPAARRLEQAAELPGSPSYLPRLVARLRSQAGDLDAAALFLGQMAQDAPDEYTRAEYLRALDEIETERRARFLDAARAEYRRRNDRDIVRVEDLLAGPEPVLRELPPELHGWDWVLDEEDGRIMSAYYGRRYEVTITEYARRKREGWKRGEEGASDGT